MSLGQDLGLQDENAIDSHLINLVTFGHIEGSIERCFREGRNNSNYIKT